MGKFIKVEDKVSESIIERIKKLPLEEKIERINKIRLLLHEISPFKNDWWCKGLGLTQPKSEAYGKYLKIKKLRLQKENA